MTIETNGRKGKCSYTKGNVGHLATQLPAASMKIDKAMLMRRTLINGMLGGLLLHTIMPSNVVASDSGQEITEDMIQDFLRRILLIVRHDDLTDRDFIERTLNGKFELTKEGEAKTTYQKSVMTHWHAFRFTTTQEPLLQILVAGGHEYDVSTSLAGLRPEVNFRIVFDFPLRGIGFEPRHLLQVFGKPMFEHHRTMEVFNSNERGYRHRILRISRNVTADFASS